MARSLHTLRGIHRGVLPGRQTEAMDIYLSLEIYSFFFFVSIPSHYHELGKQMSWGRDPGATYDITHRYLGGFKGRHGGNGVFQGGHPILALFHASHFCFPFLCLFPSLRFLLLSFFHLPLLTRTRVRLVSRGVFRGMAAECFWFGSSRVWKLASHGVYGSMDWPGGESLRRKPWRNSVHRQVQSTAVYTP